MQTHRNDTRALNIGHLSVAFISVPGNFDFSVLTNQDINRDNIDKPSKNVA